MVNRRTARKRLEELKSELEALRDAAASDAGLEEGQVESVGELASYDQNEADVGSEMFEREKTYSVVVGLEERLREVEDAFRRVEEGAYGICEQCGQPIPGERLEARPDARLCTEHQAEASRL